MTTRILIVMALGLAACGTPTPDPVAGAAQTTPPTAAPATPAPTTTAPAAVLDPFEVYLSLAPADAPEMTRDDAQARALIGCSTTWAPGTVDAALAEAYATLIEQWRAQGMCG